MSNLDALFLHILVFGIFFDRYQTGLLHQRSSLLAEGGQGVPRILASIAGPLGKEEFVFFVDLPLPPDEVGALGLLAFGGALLCRSLLQTDLGETPLAFLPLFGQLIPLSFKNLVSDPLWFVLVLLRCSRERRLKATLLEVS